MSWRAEAQKGHISGMSPTETTITMKSSGRPIFTKSVKF